MNKKNLADYLGYDDPLNNRTIDKIINLPRFPKPVMNTYYSKIEIDEWLAGRSREGLDPDFVEREAERILSEAQL